MTNKKPVWWVSRYQIISERLLLNLGGKKIIHKKTAQKYMEKLKSYCERKNEKGQLTHYVTINDVDDWNQKVINKLEKFPRKTYDAANQS